MAVSRIIKFRGFHLATGEMYSPEKMNDSGLVLSATGGVWCGDEELRVSEPNWVLMQYTGLKDKNGVEIYENDVVKNKKGIVGLVNYSERGTRFGLHTTKPHYITGEPHSKYYSLIGCEIIGNIHQNPELIK